jgi:hypothetical protein
MTLAERLAQMLKLPVSICAQSQAAKTALILPFAVLAALRENYVGLTQNRS